MSRLTNALRIIAGIGLAVLAASCGSDGDRITTPGSGSRSPNAPAFIEGNVTYADGTAPETGDAEVTLYKIYRAPDDEFEWERISSIYTEEGGAYRFDSLAAGEYSLFTREDPYLPTGEKLLNGFGGYLTVADDDTGRVGGDTIVLRKNYLVTGRFTGSAAQRIRVSIVGTEYASIISSTPYMDPYFAFGGLPVADFRLKVILNYGSPNALSFIAPLPVIPDYAGDTTYTKTTYDFTSGVRISGNSVELITPYFTLTCLIEEDRFAKAALPKASGTRVSTIYR